MLRFSKHAIERMNERGITGNDVVQALKRKIDQPIAGRQGTIIHRCHASSGKILKIYTPATDNGYIITVVEED